MARIAFLMDAEFEDGVFQGPYEAMRRAGHDCRVVGLVRGARLMGKRAESHADVEEALDRVDPLGFDALLIPGGHGPGRLRTHPNARAFVRSFVDRNVPIAAICHGLELLVAVDGVRGRTLTSWPSIRGEIEGAGATWIDQPVVEDGNLITSSKPADVQAFVAAFARLVPPVPAVPAGGAGPKRRPAPGRPTGPAASGASR